MKKDRFLGCLNFLGKQMWATEVIMYRVSTILFVVQDFATIHSIIPQLFRARASYNSSTRWLECKEKSSIHQRFSSVVLWVEKKRSETGTKGPHPFVEKKASIVTFKFRGRKNKDSWLLAVDFSICFSLVFGCYWLDHLEGSGFPGWVNVAMSMSEDLPNSISSPS